MSTPSQGASRTPATATHLFVVAGFVPELPLSEQPALALRWWVTNAATAVPHSSGKVAIVGHTRLPPRRPLRPDDDLWD